MIELVLEVETVLVLMHYFVNDMKVEEPDLYHG